jgi:hypothetical protein
MDAGIIVKSEIFLLTGIETGFFFFFFVNSAYVEGRR